MSIAPFDPSGFFEFDLARGAVRTRSGERVVVVTGEVLAPLFTSALKTGDVSAVRKLGKQLGKAAAQGLASVASSPPEVVLGRAADVLSLFGWGRLRVERWGDALVARLDGGPALDAEHLGVGALLGGLFSALADRDVACVPIGSGATYLVVHPSIASQVWKWSRAGDDVPAIVSRLAPEGS